MNLLVEKASDYLTVGGDKIKIKTDFFAWAAFITACDKRDDERIIAAVLDIFGYMPQNWDELFEACMKWMFPAGNSGSQAKGISEQRKKATPFDFEEDGSIIYCELWQYFPHLMERGISFPEGMELIGLLLNNEDTMLWHRAFARCGDFKGMSKEQKKYWEKQRAIYAIRKPSGNVDDIMSGAFW